MFGVRIAPDPQIEFTQMDRKCRVVAKKGAGPMPPNPSSRRMPAIAPQKSESRSPACPETVAMLSGASSLDASIC